MSNKAQRSFAVGEVSPKLHARADLQRYQEALRSLRNAIVTKEGGVQSRAGTLYKGTTKASAAAFLVPCVFSSTQNYLLEFGAGYIRFWLAGAQVTVSGVVAWANTTAYVVGDIRSYLGVNYYCIAAHTSVQADNRPSDGTTYLTKWYALTGAILEVPTPYTAGDLTDLSFADADASTRFVAHPSYPLRELIRVGATHWTFTAVVYAIADDVDAPTNVAITGTAGSNAADDTRFQVTALNGALESEVSSTVQWSRWPGPTTSGNYSPITVTWDAVAGATQYKLYVSVQGAAFKRRVTLDSTQLSFEDIGQAITDGAATSPPSSATQVTDLTAAGLYPGVIATYQQRLIVAGQTNNPDTVYASRAGNFRNFFPHSPLQDDDALSWRQVGGRLNRITNVAEVAGALVLWSEVSEGTARGDTDGILRPGEVNPQIISYNGADVSLDLLQVNDTALYVQARGGIVRDLRPQDNIGTDLTVTASHLVTGYTLVDAAYQQTPHSVCWFVRSDGVLLSLTYSRETGVFGWARHDTDGLVESVAVVPEGTEDAVYVIIRRTINSSTVRYLERLADRTDTTYLPIAMDSAVIWTAP